MLINGKNPNTGEEYRAEADGVDEDFVESMSDFGLDDDVIKRFIDNLDISADVKALLYKFTRATIQAGQYVIKIGRKIIDFVVTIYKQYPSATFGMIFGAIAGYLVSTKNTGPRRGVHSNFPSFFFYNTPIVIKYLYFVGIPTPQLHHCTFTCVMFTKKS